MKKIAVTLLSLIMLLATCSSGNNRSNEDTSADNNNDVDDTVSGTLVVYTTTYDIDVLHYSFLYVFGRIYQHASTNLSCIQLFPENQ